MRLDDLYLWYLGDDAPRYVGALKLVSAGKGVSLHYGAEWLAKGFALSDDLPLRDIEFLPPGRLATSAPCAVGAVDDARPDRWGEKVIRFVDKPKRISLMELLYYAGDDRFGALGVSLSPTEYRPRKGGPLPRLEQAQTLSDVVAKVDAGEALTALETKMIEGGGSPLGGAKPKALINIDGTQWVIKFFNNEYVDAPLVEHATMTLAAKAGITVAQTRVLALEVAHAIAVRRFDREGDHRIHCISAGTAIRADAPAGSEPEMGYPQLAQVLRKHGIAYGQKKLADMHELFRRMVFNILVDNTDDHEKNHSLMIVRPRDNGRLQLSPAYDVLPTNSGQGYQEFICGDKGYESSLDNAMSQCDLFDLTASQAADIVVGIIQVVDTWREHFEQMGVSSADVDYLAQYIDGEELLNQRRAFNPSAYRRNAGKPSPHNPFRM